MRAPHPPCRSGNCGLEGFGLVQALLPGLAPEPVEILGGFKVEGLADAVRRMLDQRTVHGLGASEEGELPAIVRTAISRAEIERVGACDDALLGDRFPATKAQMDQIHGWPPRMAWSRNDGVK